LAPPTVEAPTADVTHVTPVVTPATLAHSPPPAIVVQEVAPAATEVVAPSTKADSVVVRPPSLRPLC